jgi:DNA-binding YbaB/EbfC family protein
MSDERGPGNLMSMLAQAMDQARSMQTRLQDVQEKARFITVEGSAGGGLVRVVANGAARIQSVRIDPGIWSGDREAAEDLITAAVNDALRRAAEKVEKEVGAVTGGLDVPGLANLLRPPGA